MNRIVFAVAHWGSALGMVLLAARSGEASAAETLQSIMDDHWAFTLRENPILATRVGAGGDHDDRLGDISPAAHQRRAARNRDFARRLDAIHPAALPSEPLMLQMPAVLHAKPGSWLAVKMPFPAAVYPESLQIALPAIRKSQRSFWWKEILPVDPRPWVGIT